MCLSPLRNLQHTANRPHLSAHPSERARVILATSTNQEVIPKEAMKSLWPMLSQEGFSLRRCGAPAGCQQSETIQKICVY